MYHLRRPPTCNIKGAEAEAEAEEAWAAVIAEQCMSWDIPAVCPPPFAAPSPHYAWGFLVLGVF